MAPADRSTPHLRRNETTQMTFSDIEDTTLRSHSVPRVGQKSG